jgi:hypothetical protein
MNATENESNEHAPKRKKQKQRACDQHKYDGSDLEGGEGIPA